MLSSKTVSRKKNPSKKYKLIVSGVKKSLFKKRQYDAIGLNNVFMISYKVTDTAIRKHVKTEKGHFTMNGRHYTYARLEMKKDVFEQLIAEAKQAKAQ